MLKEERFTNWKISEATFRSIRTWRGRSIGPEILRCPLLVSRRRAKRAIMSWSNTITEDDVTDDFKAFFLDAVKWLAGDGKKVLFSPPPMNDGELVLVAILEENGYTVSEDENSSSGSGGLPPVSGSEAVDIVIMGKNVAVSRFANYKKPVLTCWSAASAQP